jgi:hypothetical protein
VIAKENEIFRESCLCSSLINEFVKQIGSGYLISSIGKTIQKVCKEPKKSFEVCPSVLCPVDTFSSQIDPKLVPDSKERQSRLKNLKECCTTIFKSIVRAAPKLPT